MSDTKNEIEQGVSSNTPALTNSEESINSLNNLNLFNSSNLAAAETLLNKIMKSDKGGIKNVNDGIAILLRAQELNLPFSTCIEHIHVINGKTGVDIHIIKALLSRAACTWKLLKDYQAQYEYTDGINVYNEYELPDYTIKCKSVKDAEDRAIKDENDEYVYVYPVKWYSDFNGNIYRDYQLNKNKFTIIRTREEAVNLASKGIIGIYRIAAKPIDYVTEYEITRTIKGKEVTAIGRFSYSEAVAAKMFDKDTYQKYPKVLISHRAFTYAARDIASDILFGVCETTELKIVNNVELNKKDVIDIENDNIIDVEVQYE